MAEKTYGRQKITRAGLTHSLSVKPRKTRAMRRPRDIFRRVYTVWVDLTGPTEGMVGLIERNFTAPIQIPDKYHKIDPEKPWRMYIDFVGYVNELRRAFHDWETLGKFHSRRMYADKYKGGTNFSAPVLEIIGTRPMPWELVALTARGDPWCIGQQRHPTPAVIKIGEGWPAFNQLAAVPGARTFKPEVDPNLRLPMELEMLVGKRGQPTDVWEDEEQDEVEFERAMAEYADEEPPEMGVDPEDDDDDEGDLGEGFPDVGMPDEEVEELEPELTPAQKRAATIRAKKEAQKQEV